MARLGPASTSPALREVGAERSVRVTEYRCPLAKGAPVAVEQFSQPTISIVRSGVFGFRSGRDDQLLSTGFVLLANPGQCYEISHDHCGGDRCLIFRVDDAVLEDIGGRDPRSTGKRFFARSVLPPIPRVDALRLLAEQRLASGGAGLGLEELGLALAGCVLEHTAAPPRRVPAATRRARDAIFVALDHLERNAGEDCSLSGLAAVVGLSPYHFLRLFKREVGVTPYRFLVQARIRKAVELLRDTRLPVTAIALSVGFGDLSNFIHTFRREIGCSPSQFRKAEPRDWAIALEAARPALARWRG
ncbi:MAG TPA: AraC family transcriptional regulator [Kofleriaceae bacterium]|nr:AraC family transcriptional regulator [Kofleriaceae bacterium]